MNRRVTPEEENVIMDGYNTHGNNWRAIHDYMLGMLLLKFLTCNT